MTSEARPSRRRSGRVPTVARYQWGPAGTERRRLRVEGVDRLEPVTEESGRFRVEAGAKDVADRGRAGPPPVDDRADVVGHPGAGRLGAEQPGVEQVEAAEAFTAVVGRHGPARPLVVEKRVGEQVGDRAGILEGRQPNGGAGRRHCGIHLGLLSHQDWATWWTLWGAAPRPIVEAVGVSFGHVQAW